MGLYDSNKVNIGNDVAVKRETLSGQFSSVAVTAGELFRISNSNLKYKTLAITLEVSIADQSADKTFNWYYVVYGQTNNPILHRDDGALLYSRGGSSDFQSQLSLDDIHNYQQDTYRDYRATFYVDVSLIDTFIVSSKNTNSNLTLKVSYILMQDVPEVFSRKTIQCLLRKSITLQSGTMSYGGEGNLEIRRFIPDFKYFFVVLKSSVSINGFIDLYERVGKIKDGLGYNLNDAIARETIPLSNVDCFKTGWKEICGTGCVLIISLVDAVSQDENVDIQIFGVR